MTSLWKQEAARALGLASETAEAVKKMWGSFGGSPLLLQSRRPRGQTSANQFGSVQGGEGGFLLFVLFNHPCCPDKSCLSSISAETSAGFALGAGQPLLMCLVGI